MVVGGWGGEVMKSELAQVCFTAGLAEQCIQNLSFYICGVTQKLTTRDGEGTNELSNHYLKTGLQFQMQHSVNI